MKSVTVLGIDSGKNSCSVAGLDEAGRVVLRRRLPRDGLAALLDKQPGCVVAMEACCGAHFVGRSAQARGHEVRLMPPEYVRPYVKAQKNDDRDAEAIAEAATRPTMRFVPLKAEAQLDVQALHRARERLVAERTALINQMRALLLERGIVLPQRRRSVSEWVDATLTEGEDDPLSPRIRLLVNDMRAEWAELDRRIGVFDDEFATSARNDEAARRLSTVPGIGPINATALVSAVGDASAFRRARDLVAWLGLAACRVGVPWRGILRQAAGMSSFIPFNRDQAFLMPPDLKSWLPEDDLAHFVVAAVERVPLAAYEVPRRTGGKLQYHPRLMLALLIHCYANGIFSSRRIERATYRDVAVRFVAANLHPDHDTVASFRRTNKAAIEAAFLHVLLLAREAGLLQLGTVSIDGTKIDADASKIRSVRYDRATVLRAKLAADIAALTARRRRPTAQTRIRRRCQPSWPGVGH